MRRPTRRNPVRYSVTLPGDLSERFEALAAKPGATKSSILAAALRMSLEERGVTEAEQRFVMRLDRISGQLARIERNSHVLLESLALFVRYMLTINAPLAHEDEASRAIGRDRFNAFVARVAQQLAGGRNTFDPEEGA